jgi:hypothetical protein
MTVESTTAKVTRLGNDAATSFSFTFTIYASTDLVVTKVDSDGNETVLAEGSSSTTYSVSVASYPGSGSITYPAVGGTPLATGESLVIKRVLPLEQTLDLENQGGYYPENQEQAFDKAIMIDLQQQEELDRTVKLPVGSGIDGNIPAPAAAGGYLRVNEAGTAVEVATLATTDGSASDSTPIDVSLSAGAAGVAADYSRKDHVHFLPNITPAGATSARAITAHLADVVNVKNFGATGDGTTDDTTAIQAAVDYAATLVGSTTAYGGEGRTVFFPDGEYVITAAIEMDNIDGVSLVGSPGRGAVLKLTTDSTSIIKVGDLSGADVSCYGNEFHNLHFRTEIDSTTTVGIEGIRAIDTTIESCQFQNLATSIYGHKFSQLYVRGSRFIHTSERSTTKAIAHIHLKSNTSTGDSGQGGGVHVSDCEFEGRASDDVLTNGVLLESCDGFYMQNCHFNSMNYAIHIETDGVTEKFITDIKIQNCYFDALQATTNVWLDGSLDGISDTYYQNIEFDNCLFRGGTSATRNVLMRVTDVSTFVSSGKKIKNISFNNCNFRQTTTQAVLIDGDPNYIEPYDVVFNSCVFAEHNSGGSAATSGVQAEAESVLITGCLFLADDTATDKVIQCTTSLPNSNQPSFIVANNDMSQSNADGNIVGFSATSGASFNLSDNLFPNNGNRISQMYSVTTTDATATDIFRITIPLKQSGYCRAVFCAKDQGTEYGIYTVDAYFHRNNTGSLTIDNTPSITGFESTSGMGVSLGASSNYLLAQVTGVAATTIEWTVHIELVTSI